MKRLLLLGLWFFLVGWFSTDRKMTRLFFDNNLWISDHCESLTLEMSEPQAGILYLNNEKYLEVAEDDFVLDGDCYKKQFMVDQEGWYSFYNQSGQCLAYAAYLNEEEIMIGSDHLYRNEKNILFFKEEANVFFISDDSKALFNGLETKKVGKWLVYTVALDKEENKYVEFGKTNCTFVLDRQSPVLTYPSSYFQHQDYLYIEEKYLDLERSSILINGSERIDQLEKNEHGYLLPISESSLIELECYDLAGNVVKESKKLILDAQAPIIILPDAYINSSQILQIQESNLDLERSSVLINGNESINLLKKNEDCYILPIMESSAIEIECYDLAGNKAQVSKKIIFDNESPIVNSVFKNNQYILNIDDEAIDLENQIMLQLYQDGKSIPFIIDDKKCCLDVSEDGVYRWKGQIKDLAGNITEVDEMMYIDVEKPEISFSYEERDFYDEPITVHLAWYDRGMKYWQVCVYREDILIDYFNGKTNGSKNIILDDKDYVDGHSVYRIELMASDGIHDVSVERNFLFDLRCAPIEVRIQNTSADHVEELTVLQPLDISLYCSEGTVNWILYQENQILQSGRGDIVLTPEQKSTHLEMWAIDDFGHEIKKTLRLNCLSNEKNEVITLWDGHQQINQDNWKMNGTILTGSVLEDGVVDVYIDGKKMTPEVNDGNFEIDVNDAKKHDIAIAYENSNGILTVSEWQLTGGKNHHIWVYVFVIGGVLFAFNFMRRQHSKCVRNREDDTTLLDTTIIENSSENH